ncbi:MAG: bifunctional phosphoribosylaminoimidazolecarboxamide formyltransferase/IMP cyclohydrolase, partial [Candidatus Omnitrophica bacterium]|nr:bifunctional phosphoribosylaminoimidazolecarboxamide formyltransferase/IMP cyclohydrolase [Candidatus Omnitrophota bacterium]
IEMIDMVVVNLYPFEKTVAKKHVKLEEAIENIDIGGPSMLRSAAKNYRSVAVITNPAKYPEIIKELKANKGALSEETLKDLAFEVFRRTAEYDKAIYEYLAKKPEVRSQKSEEISDSLNLNFEKVQDLRYGENPHQKAHFYRDPNANEAGICNAKQLQGKELSFNNIIDLNAAIEIVKEFNEPAASVIKHTNPCGAATGKDLIEAYKNALDCDRMSAFGSIVGFNGTVDGKLAETIMKEADFVECIIAPSFDKKARLRFSAKKNLRLLEVPDYKKTSHREQDLKKVIGGVLLQDVDIKSISEKDLKVVTKTKPSKEEINSLLFGWRIVKHLKSNAIVLSQGTKTVGMGAGQMSRVDSVIIAARKAGSKTKGATLASDAFFPKPDAIEQAHKAGIKAIIQPGGSKADADIVQACDKYGISMAFTGFRHFKH